MSGALLIVAGLLSPSVPGFILALLVSILLLAHFGRSFAAKKKPMPAIPMIALSGICHRFDRDRLVCQIATSMRTDSPRSIWDWSLGCGDFGLPANGLPRTETFES